MQSREDLLRIAPTIGFNGGDVPVGTAPSAAGVESLPSALEAQFQLAYLSTLSRESFKPESIREIKPQKHF